MNEYHFKLYKNHYLCIRSDQPVLLSADGVSGAYHPSAILTGSNSSAFDVVMRALARSPKPGDPPVTVNSEPGANFDEYAWQYLRIRDDEIERARLITKIVDRIDDAKRTATGKQ